MTGLKFKTGGVFRDLGGGSQAYVRPSDWLPLPAVNVGDQKFVGLVAVWPGDSNWVSVTFSGNYIVDWGNGSAPDNVASGTAISHNYSYASVPGTDCSRGYRQAVVTVTPQSGQDLTVVDLPSTRPTGMVSGWSSPWLDIKMAGANVTQLIVSDSTTSATLLEQFEYVGSSSITDSSGGFRDSSSLKSLIGVEWTGAKTTFSNLFYGCRSLQEIPLLDTSSGINFSSMFLGCTSLQTIPLFDTSSGTNFSTMFSGCGSLQTIPLLNTSSGISFQSMFASCSSLQMIPLLNVSAGTFFTSMFLSCSSLQVGALSGTSRSISYASCKLSRVQLNAIYSALATVPASPAQTITVSSNWGAATDTPTIATSKGWFVTG